MGRKRIDLTNVRFGRLMAIKRAEDYISSNGKRQSQWLCKCDCGNDNIIVSANSLRRGLTKSCGCLSKETLSNRRKKSDYILSEEHGIGYTVNNEEFYFDLEDYDLIKDYNWYIDAGGYVCANIQDDNIRTHIKLHRLVMRCDDSKLDIDHINHKKNR